MPKFLDRKTLVVVPSSYNSITEDELEKAGANVVIYANQLLRSAFPAMQSTAQSILKHSRSLECDESMLSIKEILNLDTRDKIMIDVKEFFDSLRDQGVTNFSGVPDSLLKNICAYISDNTHQKSI